MAQTNEVIQMLKELYPKVEFVVGQQDTVGDQVQDRHLSDLGTSTSSGLFTKSLEDSLLNRTCSFAVHSLKDMPTVLPDGLVLGAICERESPEDAVIIHSKHKEKGIRRIEDLPEKCVIGTSSLRREALLRRNYPTLEIKTIRGNIQTRLAKLEDDDTYDAIIVAACGFRRGGLGDRIDQLLSPETFGYGVGQGSIGIECRKDDIKVRPIFHVSMQCGNSYTQILDMIQKIEHCSSAQRCKAERSLLYHLEGGCQIAMGVNCILHHSTLTLTSTVISRDGAQSVTDSISGSPTNAEELGKVLAFRFLSNPIAAALLGDIKTKRYPTYGNIEAPGDAAAFYSET